MLKPKAKKEKFELLTLEQIEANFELKTIAFEKKMAAYNKSLVVPLTFKMIMKYTVPDYKFIEKEIDEEIKEEEEDDELSDSPEDKEARIISEKKNIKDTMR
jgi:hypothetical protein